MKAAGLRPLTDERGVALLIVLFMIVVIGLTLSIAGSTWQSVVQRAREAELFWRGDQYRKAIGSYYEIKHGKGAGVFPRTLEELVKDPRFANVHKHIRRLYDDPMTKGDWVLIKDQSGRITGVKSSSELEPFRQDGFPEEYESFAGSPSYSAWEFVYEPKKKKHANKPVQNKAEEKP